MISLTPNGWGGLTLVSDSDVWKIRIKGTRDWGGRMGWDGMQGGMRTCLLILRTPHLHRVLDALDKRRVVAVACDVGVVAAGPVDVFDGFSLFTRLLSGFLIHLRMDGCYR